MKMRSYKTPEQVLQEVASLASVYRLSPVEVRMVTIDADRAPVVSAEVIIQTGSDLVPYPTTVAHTVYGEDVADAMERLARVLDDWMILRRVNVPRLLDTGTDYLMPTDYEARS